MPLTHDTNVGYKSQQTSSCSAQNVLTLSGGRVNLAAGTLYGAINTLLDKGYITSLPGEENSRKKEYKITNTGSEAVTGELERLRELVRNGELVLGRSGQ